MIEGRGSIARLAYVGMGLVEILFYLPLLLVVGVYTLPDTAAFIWLAALSLLYAITALLYRLNWTHKPLWRILLSAALSLGLIASVLLTAGEGMKLPALLACGFIGALLTERGFAMRRAGWNQSFSSAHQFFGIMAYLVILFLRAIYLHELDAYVRFLNFSGMAAVLAFLALMNERHLRKELLESRKTKAAAASQRRNRAMMIILSAVLIVIAFFHQLQNSLNHAIKSFMKWIFSWFGGSESAPPPPETAPPPIQPPLAAEANERSPILEFIEEWIKNIVLVLVAIALLVALYLIMKRVAAYVMKLYVRLMNKDLDNRRKGKDESGYEDEVERLMSLNEWGKQFGKRFKGKSLHPLDKWDELTANDARIRSLFRQMLRKEMREGYEHRSSLTPRETAEELGRRTDDRLGEELEALVQTYEAARYGGKLPSDEQIAKHSSWLKLVHKK
ncbi:DUF4129 domain-containing protein [Paenibacillus sp. HB172176]|uniref:DUF4129 domain-containing protein n=1 Tax=Paenibacillus sp. HB172176 TaxID=2493690 RepID=UPI00143BB62F|nr:DUF4129 domain-containing protein [Paenibacillus sp. HB172176]